MLNMHEKTGEFFYGTGYELLAQYAIFEKVFIRDNPLIEETQKFTMN